VSIFNSCTLNRQSQNRSDVYSGSFASNFKGNEQCLIINEHVGIKNFNSNSIRNRAGYDFLIENKLTLENAENYVKVNPQIAVIPQIILKYVPHKMRKTQPRPIDSLSQQVQNDLYYLQKARKSAKISLILGAIVLTIIGIFLSPFAVYFGLQSIAFLSQVKKRKFDWKTIIFALIGMTIGVLGCLVLYEFFTWSA
jgi:hypothetical protein